MGRLFLCLVVAWCWVALLLVAPVHGRVGLPGEFSGDQRPVPATSFDLVTEPKTKQPRGVKGTRRPSWSSWSSTASRSSPPPGRGAPSAAAAAELRSVPAGPDPMHHHGSPRRPEHARSTGRP
ncbi:protein FLORAL ORGAN NUMBER2 precursor [Oryza sativa Japonica Group]|uniref:Protein FLORAL ORGAN NUMBER2 n=2 Tax=Oryza sativa TaxID=4530 RepID=FON2_ORYSJ|nr:protein FLORAL ORGAN NUMBER2 precursor [Oryza sativa Japonica Group]A0MH06.1 RecName: Full=Protein FLORAL ORGAN NUMBER2; Short=OsFON2; AltName: Full=CLAVATA3-like protein; AltName: Full=Protein FLORAL ORGAN NUMBER4; Flags: Precursor [Oryza sativa Japonica Group]A2ZFY7.1 RecName: Full=Protein FLORAL ORGAN NUMBER2; Short=OsFON2; AltName: Full=CLAVATA3-like protein; Flags: Precursor [Oryza sativa Indica Group]ABH03378.1 floral organ number 4 [Oryza sativa Japonica Group]EAY81521.1 hypothetical 